MRSYWNCRTLSHVAKRDTRSQLSGFTTHMTQQSRRCNVVYCNILVQLDLARFTGEGTQTPRETID